ncbi:MAG: LysM peptidoglycan-binding domain-containing protein, partial [Anaerolineae bacterium]|nr:LysM peptidoglycan-binding domain-containing protein [Anaerolineae bacterium]
ALIERATQQAAVEMTQTAQAIFTPIIPTLPPTSVFATATPIPPIGQPGGSCVHVVSKGENLFRIALRYDTTVEILAAQNGIANINLILVGQQIVIPNCSGGGQVPPPPPGGGTYHTVMMNENLFRISLRYGVSLSAILAANPQITNANLIYIGQQILIPGI